MGLAMVLYSFIGFVIGMVAGGMLNRHLLRNVPKSEWLNNRDIKMKYGGLNWLIAILGAVAGYYLSK